MSDPRSADADTPREPREEEGVHHLLEPVEQAIDAADASRLVALAGELRAPDLADLIELVDSEKRARFVELMGEAFDYEALTELEPAVRDQLSEVLPNAVLARAAQELDTDDAAYVLESLEPQDREEVLSQIPDEGDRAVLERALEYPEETAGRIMQPDVVAVAPFWTVGHVIDHMREAEDLPDSFQEIYVVDPGHKVLGAVDLSRLLRTKRHVPVTEIMDPDRQVVLASADQEEVARQFERYGLMSAPVVDENRRLVGVVTVDDVVEVIEQEAEEDIKALAGVGDERLSDTVRQIAGSRFWWLLVNLGTAILSSTIIRTFGATIEQMVALAALMPIVASMGGNAGTQTMTVTVRAIATRELTAANTLRVVLREVSVGLLNGILFALILGLVVLALFGIGKLSLVIGVAMVVNMLAAALAGIFIPLALDRLDYDPAVSSTVFVTAITDVVGFVAFLGLASMVLV